MHVRYVDAPGGEKEEGDRNRTVLLVHGLGGSIESWTNNIGALSAQLRVVALDLPGFGYSDKPLMNYTIKFYSSFLARFIDKMQIQKQQLTVVGSSLGGHVAAELALSHPDALSKLVLISPPGALPRSFAGSPALRRYVRVLQARSVNEVKKALYAVDGRPVDDGYAQAVYERLSAPGAKEAFLSALAGSARAPRLNRRLENIKAPAMLMWGKDDIMIPVEYAEPFIKAKNFRVVLLEKCGHRPHADRPDVFNRLVAGFALE
jgi:pimeloyl-ACP methyl ester carboxylesterase